jgi:putative ABC transport system permease protein
MPGGGFGWRAALRLAWREARSASPRFVFVVLAIAAGVGALTGVRSFGRAFEAALLEQARTLMAGDLLVRSFEAPTPEQEAALARLEAQGLKTARIIETVSMAGAETGEAPVLVAVKAVDPSVYPFYGEVKLDPAGPLGEVLSADAAAVSEDLLLRLSARAGDTLRLGQAQFRIAAILRLEPDRLTGSLNVGPRVMISREGLEKTGLIGPLSRVSRRYLVKLPAAGMTVEEVRGELRAAFPNALVTDFREVHPQLRRALERATTFLSLVSLLALMIAASGAAMAVRAHIEQRMDTIAILKCLGGRSGQITRIFLLQTLLLGLAGGLAGVPVGLAVQAVFPYLLPQYVPLRPAPVFDAGSLLQGIAAALLAALAFAMPRLTVVSGIPPAILFRREMGDARRLWRERVWRTGAAWLVGALAAAGAVFVGAWVAGGGARQLRTSLVFLVAFAVSLVILRLLAWALAHVLRLVSARLPAAVPAVVRHGIANLFRPGGHAPAVLASLGLGVTFTLSVYLVQHNLLEELARAAPRRLPNVFLINVTSEQREGLLELVRAQEGVEGSPRLIASTRARIRAVNSVPVTELALEGWHRRYRREQTVVAMEEKPPELDLVAGAWMAEGGTGVPVCVSEEAARVLNLRPGAEIEWTAGGVEFSARVACIHRWEGERFGPDFDFIFAPEALAGVPVSYFAGVRMRPENVAVLQRGVWERYPTLTVINAAEVLEIVQEVLDQVARIVRFVAAFAILAGAVVLASSVAGTRFARIREAAILKTLGARRRQVIAVFSVEFLILGAVAGLAGGLLAGGFTRLWLVRLLEAPFRFAWEPIAAAAGLTALLAAGVGWAASYRVLGHRPLEVLRNE